uniref:Uncharacterized protein n=1 Tax=Anguilla anguilla TaxID=7936 RepID=A0A0E9XXT6_ANGAN
MRAHSHSWQGTFLVSYCALAWQIYIDYFYI